MKKKRQLSGHSSPPEKLTTPWTASVTPENVWKEYPRPAMVRDGWINLNGLWDYAITGVPDMPESFDGRILVPFSPESPLSGVNRQLQPEEYLWYRRSVTVHRPEEGRRLLLHFGAVDQRCVIYIDGKKAGAHSGGYLPFCLDITPFLPEAGPDRMDASSVTFGLLVRVQDLSDTSWQSRGKQKLKRGGMFYTAQSGIWQTVWMEEVPSVYISSVLAVPDFDHARCRLLVQVTDTREVNRQSRRTDTAAGKHTVTALIRPETEADRLSRDDPASALRHERKPESDPSAADSAEDAGTLLSFSAGEEASVSLPAFHPWTPEDPFLYHLTVQTNRTGWNAILP